MTPRRTLTARVATFNVNMFSPIAVQKRRIRQLCAAPVDVVGLQEVTKLDLAAVVLPGWRVWQDMSTRGTRNTAVMWRDHLTARPLPLVPYIDSPDDSLGARFICPVDFGPLGIIASAHRQPFRDSEGWGKADKVMGEWAAGKPRVLVCMDTNQYRHGPMKRATKLDWRGVEIDGFAYRGLALSRPDVLPEPASDHPCVVVTVTIEEKP